MDIMKNIGPAMELAKIRLGLFIALSALSGYMIHKPVPSFHGFLIAFAVFILSCGCGSLNNLQDRKKDHLSQRTCGRALPKKRLNPGYAGIQAFLLISAGLGMLNHLSTGTVTVILGCLSIILYNGLYTPLKSISLFALVPGIMCGMAAPLIGWAGADGGVPDLRLWSIMVIIALWQLPHLGLLLLLHLADYSKGNTYCFLRHVRKDALGRMIFLWVLNLTAMMLFLILQGVLISQSAQVLMVVDAALLVLMFSIKFLYSRCPSYRYLFVHLNITLLFAMVLLVVERVLLFL